MSRNPPFGGGRGGLPARSPGPGSYPDPSGFPPRRPVADAPRSSYTQPHSPRAAPPPAGPPIQLRIAKVEDKTLQTRLIYENVSAVSPADFRSPDGGDLHIMLRNQDGGEFVVSARPISGFPQGYISLSDPQRTWCRIGIRDVFQGSVWSPFSQPGPAYVLTMDVEVSFASQNKKTQEKYDEEDLGRRFTRGFENQVVSPGQRLLLDVSGIPLLIIVKSITLGDLGRLEEGLTAYHDDRHRGILIGQTDVIFRKDQKGEVQMKASMRRPNTNAPIGSDFKFEDMGIGGLADQFEVMFRRAFASRTMPPALVQSLNIKHVKGILLYGPPGTGKTLIARQIGKLLNVREPKVINGPEILNKYVGQSEENVRKIFADAEKEEKEKGDESGLHIIIFDEFDAICKQRGSGGGGGTGVGDNIVNQLLTKLDGVEQLNNILLIGMTNRRDLIDEAVLRPGRLELHLEITLPNEEGRREIFTIHTAQIRDNGYLGKDVSVNELAALAKNYSGAEIAGVVRSATSFAFQRHTKVGQRAAIKDDLASMQITRNDFMSGLDEVQPQFGADEDNLSAMVDMGIIQFNEEHMRSLFERGQEFVSVVRGSADGTGGRRLQKVLFHGVPGTGKTALAAQIAIDSKYDFIKVVKPYDLVAFGSELARADYIKKVFADAHKSKLSLLILDDLEDLIDWTPIGPRFSNTILSTVMTLIRQPPPDGRRLLVFVTTGSLRVLKLLELDNKFDGMVDVRTVKTLPELAVILTKNQHFDEVTIQRICGYIQETAAMTEAERRRGEFIIDLGIKHILDFIERAASARELGKEPAAVFSNLMVDAIDLAKSGLLATEGKDKPGEMNEGY